MNARQMVAITAGSTMLTLAILAAVFLGLGQVQAAPPATGNVKYTGVSALAFAPVQQNSTFFKDTQRQLLTLTGPLRVFSYDRNVFAAPLTLPDQSQLLAMSVFGEDYDAQGEVRVRLKRCEHAQAHCVNLAEATSTAAFTGGQFETPRLAVQNEVVNNGFYTYFLELELTALGNSGLRSVRLETITGDAVAPAAEQPWTLADNVTSFPLPISALVQVRLCTNDLSYLPNATHYPFVVVDGRSISLSSGSCITVWGRDIEIRRQPNTGPSGGTYQVIN